MEGKYLQKPIFKDEAADMIIWRLKNDPEFCRGFFYGNDPKKCNIARMRSKILYDVQQNYHVRMDKDTFNGIVYLTLWAEGTWATLDTYKKRSTFFAWLKKVARNAVCQRLEEEYGICTVRKCTAGNTRLTLLSKSESRCKALLDELMPHSKHYLLLSALYVDRLTTTEIMGQLNMTESDFINARRKAETALKKAMLNTAEDRDADMIHEKKGSVTLVSSDYLADVSEWNKARTNAHLLSDVFGVNLSDEEVHEKTVRFLHDFSERMDWSNQDKYIWRSRFIDQVPPTDLARELGRSRGWVDTRYSRLNQKFNAAVRAWWHRMAS